MKKSNYIVLLDPSIRDNNGAPAFNLGDMIIYDAVMKILSEIFQKHEILRISSHEWFAKKQKKILNGSLLNIMGGTNVLTSDIRNFPRMTPEKKKGFYLFPGFNNLVLLGTGWEKYQSKPDWATIIYYYRILNKKYFHSVRDEYSLNQLKKAYVPNVLNTSCPTTWELDRDFINVFQPNYNSIFFTLTNYYPNHTIDNNLLKYIFDSGQSNLIFFPQTAVDLDYLSSLENYRNNKSKIKILKTEYSEFLHFVHSEKFNYIGSRLHAGIRCLQLGNPTLIFAVDNRALEIRKDTGLNILARTDFTLLQKWIKGEYRPERIQLPEDNISIWKKQFQDIK
ncbi:MAG: polysaccharide pyruvyl transferase family protein [Sphingobacteriales bacterium]|nr:polysaccharide pyruvyl transferase family protein [Sphingobacteriales bacterium]